MREIVPKSVSKLQKELYKVIKLNRRKRPMSLYRYMYTIAALGATFSHLIVTQSPNPIGDVEDCAHALKKTVLDGVLFFERKRRGPFEKKPT